jgi:hypothetical protein
LVKKRENQSILASRGRVDTSMLMFRMLRSSLEDLEALVPEGYQASWISPSFRLALAWTYLLRLLVISVGKWE